MPGGSAGSTAGHGMVSSGYRPRISFIRACSVRNFFSSCKNLPGVVPVSRVNRWENRVRDRPASAASSLSVGVSPSTSTRCSADSMRGSRLMNCPRAVIAETGIPGTPAGMPPPHAGVLHGSQITGALKHFGQPWLPESLRPRSPCATAGFPGRGRRSSRGPYRSDKTSRHR